MSTALIFPGQGAQYVGMGQDVAAVSPAARAVFERADARLGLPVSRWCFAGPKETLDRTDVSQPAILTVSIAVLAAWEERGARPRAACAGTAGLSLGEYTALVAAGVLAFEDALALVRARGEFMQEACDRAPSGMASLIGPDREQAEDLCAEAAQGEVLQVANVNAPGQVALSGARAALDRAVAQAAARGWRAAPLAVAGAFHSELMRPAEQRLAERIRALDFADPAFPVYSNVLAAPVHEGAALKELLVRQLTSPVLWADAMTAMAAAEIDTFYEVGPGQVLCNLLKRTVRRATRQAVGVAADLPAAP